MLGLKVPVIGIPPSSIGSFHLRSKWRSDQSVTSGAPGGRGVAELRESYLLSQLKNPSSIKLFVFTEHSRYR